MPDVLTRRRDFELLAGVSGCSRRRSAVCGYGRKLFRERAFSLVTGLSLKVCKSIAKASKVRILHLPPRAQMAPDLRKRRSGAPSCTPWGYQNWLDDSVMRSFG